MLSRRSLLIGLSAIALAGPASAEPLLQKIMKPFNGDEAVAATEPQPVQVAEVRQPAKPKKSRYGIDPKYEPQEVAFSGYKPGTIVIDTKAKFLYYVESAYSARRYGIAVGKEGLEFKGTAVVQTKREWPRWIPTKDMIKREPAHYAKYENGMDGGPGNPLGARALYLSQGNKDTHIRIHGTVQPWSIGSSASNGCFRMVNDHVIDLYDRVSVGTEVVVL
ncbi:L,D-transpeptidase [Phyllobacterium sp. 21LDTY02-6]|uniref:L,D-transpeptidase n=1 Tax=unclassified Phyllobacterium TaxID=2638441 RepID=UPI002020A170|nr:MULTISPECIES: L,D-transpeptidase [unclassified Phyllobacterium]MCO4316532.1 L,D-transpeptidase [Phyllobacterium sp. 21LDTY02-6]MCX8280666.1 L,D-transpeptidase [Phyllobacterium sp. 0TCS1.6C]MCX8292757.1 L,D-transpeptidase [Phyllobacterium sp. 0TCS1.6A]